VAYGNAASILSGRFPAFPMHRNLAAFARWFMSQPPTSWRVPQNATYQFDMQGGKASGVVLYRAGRYQAELFIVTQTGVFPEHSHPNVNSIEVLLAGHIEFIVRGRSMFRPEVIAKRLPTQGTMVGVGAGVPHGAILHEGGGSFISLQRWREGVPITSVGIDWDGPPHHDFRGAA
jgi:quercetin dioxygenase-like cupin family protein